MIKSEAWIHFNLLNQKIEILELKMEWLQLENEMLSFRLDNLARAKNFNAEEDVNERDDDIMAIGQCSPPS